MKVLSVEKHCKPASLLLNHIKGSSAYRSITKKLELEQFSQIEVGEDDTCMFGYFLPLSLVNAYKEWLSVKIDIPVKRLHCSMILHKAVPEHTDDFDSMLQYCYLHVIDASSDIFIFDKKSEIDYKNGQLITFNQRKLHGASRRKTGANSTIRPLKCPAIVICTEIIK